MTDEERNAWNNACSIESCPYAKNELILITRIQDKALKYKYFVIYKDQNNHFWYQTEYLTNKGRVSEYEYIFGKKE